MSTTIQHWKVRPHNRVVNIDEGILTVTGTIRVPMELSRRMTIVRLRDSRLVVFSAIALNEAEMIDLEGYGRPAFLIVPSDKHRLDAKMWKERYPAIQVVAPKGSRRKVEEVAVVNFVSPHFDDPSVQFVTVPGTNQKEGALIVRRPAGTTLILNDLIGNIDNATGVGGWLLRMAGFAGKSAQIPRVVKLALIKDPNALRLQFLEWAKIEPLKRILVSHGSPIEVNPNALLRELARSLEVKSASGKNPPKLIHSQ